MRPFALTQKQMDEEVHFSASRIRQSAAFGEIIIMIVYIPLMTLVGIEGKMFRPMALTVFFAILGLIHPVAHLCADGKFAPVEPQGAQQKDFL